jgi:galactokinase
MIRWWTLQIIMLVLSNHPKRSLCTSDVCRYAVRAATAHPIHENRQVERFQELMQACTSCGSPTAAECTKLGEIMFASHASYSTVGLGAPGTDKIVELVRKLIREWTGKPGSAVFGARVTGGGNGGCVCVLASDDEAGELAVRHTHAEYESWAGQGVVLHGDTSEGASSFGSIKVRMPIDNS